MNHWKPAIREPSANDAAVNDFIRFSLAEFRTGKPRPLWKLGPATLQTAEGRKLAIEIELQLGTETRFRGRDCAVYRATGHAATTAARYRLEGRVAIDLATLAFLAIEIRLIPT